MKPFFVYILECSDGSYYTGHTDNLELRISQHQLGEIKGYTQTRLPVQTVFVQTFQTRYEALASERQIKNWSRRKKKALIDQQWDNLILFSKGKNKS
jgi:predicted GIY-YIG superfamily endonuclease